MAALGRNVRRAAVVCLAIAGAGLPGSWVSEAAAQTFMRVTAQQATLHWTPNAASEVFAVLETGAVVAALDYTGDWMLVRAIVDDALMEGWVAAKWLKDYGVGPDGPTPALAGEGWAPAK